MRVKKNISCLFFFLFFFFEIFAFDSIKEEKRIELLKIIADDVYSIQKRKEAYQDLCSSSPKKEPSFISYCVPEQIEIVQEASPNLYSKIVRSMSISCIDVFIYNFEKKAYLMIQRETPPVKGIWWLPGGRIFKGESFFESAVRKSKKESGLNICPIAQLGTYSTYFSESAWGEEVHTDTKNTVVLALCDNQIVNYDEHHGAFKWIPIEVSPEDSYLSLAHKEALTKLVELQFVPNLRNVIN